MRLNPSKEIKWKESEPSKLEREKERNWGREENSSWANNWCVCASNDSPLSWQLRSRIISQIAREPAETNKAQCVRYLLTDVGCSIWDFVVRLWRIGHGNSCKIAGFSILVSPRGPQKTVEQEGEKEIITDKRHERWPYHSSLFSATYLMIDAQS